MSLSQERRDPDVAEMLAKEAAANEQHQCAREKYWSELSIEEKIERTRQMVKRTMQELEIYRVTSEAQQELITALRHDLVAHRHARNDADKVMFPASTAKTEYYERLNRGALGRGPLTPPSPDPDKVYF